MLILVIGEVPRPETHHRVSGQMVTKHTIFHYSGFTNLKTATPLLHETFVVLVASGLVIRSSLAKSITAGYPSD